MFHVPEKYRVLTGPYGSTMAYGNNGMFLIPKRKHNRKIILKTIASDGLGWEHVSVSLPNKCPSWEDMCKIKNIFWDEEDTVIQFHPPKLQYVNNHPYCLHLWRPIGINIKVPDPILLGYK